MSANKVPLSFRLQNGAKVDVEVELDSLVGDLKNVLAPLTSIEAERQRLVFSGHVLKDTSTLRSYDVKANNTIHVVKGAANNAQQQSATGSNVPTPTRIASPATAASVTPAPTAARQASPFGGLGGGLGGMQQQMMQNPDMMRQMLNSPMMQAMLDNPEFLRTMMLSNPEMQAVVEQNPELRQIFNDPAFLRQSLQMAANPELLREMQRNADRAMQNIEMMPGGFDALRRMHTNIQEPLMNAAMAARGNQTPTPTVLSAPQSQPNSAPMANPWASPAASASTAASPFQMPNLFGAGDGGFPGMGGAGTNLGGGAFPGMPNPEVMNSMMQDPSMQAVMNSMMSNPDFMEMAFNMNPQTRHLLDSNPMMRQMIRNPAFLQSMNSMMPQLRGALPPAPSTAVPVPVNPFGAFGGGGGAAGFPGLFSMFTPPPVAAAAPAASQSTAATTVTPTQAEYETRFAPELEAMRDMGFVDTPANITALLAAGGNVNSAIDYLLRQ